ncbi:MAG: YbjN domain-containing protein [Rhodospirillaceae bacterium]
MQTAALTHGLIHPIDLIEQLATGRDWTFDRRSDEEMAVEAPGQWCDYGLYFAWSEDLNALHFSCAFDMRVPPKYRPAIYELLALLNERLWIGHFSLWQEEGLPMFRQTLQAGPKGPDRRAVEDLMEIAVAECERFYPAFQFVIWGGKSATDAIAAAMLDVAGEA